MASWDEAANATAEYVEAVSQKIHRASAAYVNGELDPETYAMAILSLEDDDLLTAEAKKNLRTVAKGTIAGMRRQRMEEQA